MFDNIVTPYMFLTTLAVFAAGAAAALVFNKNDRAANLCGNIMAIIGGALGLLFSASALISGKTLRFHGASSFPGMAYSFRIDFLSAFFILIISLIALICSIYAIGYVKHYYKCYNIGVLGFFFNLFIAGMLLVVTSNNALFFLVVWELMSLASYFLVIYEHRKERSVKAGYLYFVMTHVGTSFIILSFLLMYLETGSFGFDTIKDGVSSISPLMKNAIFLSALIGFGVKAGIIPLHIWLPGAHPAAPSHVSALMSGVMIKTGIYMFIRIFFDILPNAPLWWGILIIAIGAVSALLGVLYALSEHDLKRLLAFSSIENIGIIMLGLGSSLIFLSFNMKAFAMIGVIAALYHTINHAVFKSLLFLCAGSVISETHSRNMEEYGGLIKFMPQTAFFFLAGSMAISALPPFNGFFSEWMTFQALFAGASTFDSLTKTIFVLAIGALAFTGGLAAACFVNAFGSIFLARPRGPEVSRARESAPVLRIAMAALSTGVLSLGFLSGTISHGLLNISAGLNCFKSAGNISDVLKLSAGGAQAGFSALSMPGVFIAISAAIVSVAIFTAIVSKARKVRRGITWDCGATLTPRMEITSTGFSRSIITVFKGVLRPSLQSETEYHDSNLRYFPKMTSADIKTHDFYKSHFFKPLNELIIMISNQVRKIQSGNINAYILYIVITLIGLLLILGPTAK